MRALAAAALSGLIVSAAAGLAFAAAPAEVNVTIGPALQKKTASYGVRELDHLKTELRKEVVAALARRDTPVQRVDLVIEAATPNRPTFEQLRTPGLSLDSIGVGGAAISGQITGADGSSRPVSYHWFETDLRNEIGAVTWSDAYRAFDRFASRIARGDLPNQARYTPDPRAGDFGKFYNR